MITYQFTATENMPRIFSVEKLELDKFPTPTEYLEAPLTIYITRMYDVELGVDFLQKKIAAALDKMMAELNTPTKGETK